MKTCTILLAFLYISLHVYAQSSSYTQQEVIYGRKDGMALTMLYVQPRISNGKGIIRLLSGNWISSYQRVNVIVENSAAFLQKGYTVFVVIPSSQPRYSIPDQVNDVKRAVRYIRYHAKRFRVDPVRIGITGGSSGGNLSLLVATADDKRDSTSRDVIDKVSSRVQAIAVLYPPTDFFNWGQEGSAIYKNEKLLALARVAGAFDFQVLNDTTYSYFPVIDQEKRIKIYRDVSPLYAVTPDDPPVLIIHGTKDAVVPIQQSQVIIAKFKEMNVKNQLVIKEGLGHGWSNQDAEYKLMAEWFDEHLK